MRPKALGAVIALTVSFSISTFAQAQHRNRSKGGGGVGEKSIDQQMEWEKKVMGDDHVKQADLRKIAAAQKLANESAKHPPPIAAPKVKDPNKEGVRAKQEAAIGLPIESDKDLHSGKGTRTAAGSKKVAETRSSADDELGALVASSLAEEKSTGATSTGSATRINRSKGTSAPVKGKMRGKQASAPSSLDQMFAASGK
jgi:hypothetical protein